PSYYQMAGLSQEASLAPLAWVNVGGIAGGFLGPMLSDRLRRRKPVLLGTSLITVAALGGLIAAPVHLAWLWNALIGLGVTAIFTVCLVLPVDVAPREQIAGLTGIILAVGYTSIAVGPTSVGFLRDLTGSFVPGLLLMLAVAAAMGALSAFMPETARSS